MTRGVWRAGVSRAGVSRKGKECEARLGEQQDGWVTRGRARAFGSGFWPAALGLGGEDTGASHVDRRKKSRLWRRLRC